MSAHCAKPSAVRRRIHNSPSVRLSGPADQFSVMLMVMAVVMSDRCVVFVGRSKPACLDLISRRVCDFFATVVCCSEHRILCLADSPGYTIDRSLFGFCVYSHATCGRWVRFYFAPSKQILIIHYRYFPPRAKPMR